MESPGTPSRSSGSGRSSVIDSIRGCTIAGVRIPKEDLKKKITVPEYLRLAMMEAIRAKNVGATAVVQLYEAAHAHGAQRPELPECPLVVFINPKSGGRHGPELKARLQELMSEEQVLFPFFITPISSPNQAHRHPKAKLKFYINSRNTLNYTRPCLERSLHGFSNFFF